MGLRIVQLSKECSVNGGVGTYLANLCDALVTAGHDVTHVHADTGPSVQASKGVRRFCVPRFDEFDDQSVCRIRADQVLEILESVQPDIVHIQGNNNFVLEEKIRDRFPTVKFLHVYDFCPSGNKFHHALGRTCHHPTGPLCVPRMGYKRCLLTKRPWVIWRHYSRCVAANRNNSRFARLIVASHHVKQQALATGYPASQIEVLPYFTRLPVLSASSCTSDGTILFVGRVTREKGVEYLLRALPQVRVPWRLIVAGDGMDLDRAKSLAHRLGLSERTQFVGWVSGEEQAALYANASVVVVPSVWPEPFGIVGIEAMSYAKPVVAFRVGGIPEWLGHGETGFLIRPYDLQEMADRLTYLLDDPNVASQMGRNGRRRVDERFTSEQHLPRLLEIYHEVINGRARPPAVVS